MTRLSTSARAAALPATRAALADLVPHAPPGVLRDLCMAEVNRRAGLPADDPCHARPPYGLATLIAHLLGKKRQYIAAVWAGRKPLPAAAKIIAATGCAVQPPEVSS